MNLPEIKVCLEHGDDTHPSGIAFVTSRVERRAFYGGLTYEQVARIFEKAAVTMRAFADDNPGAKTKTLEQVCARITGTK